MKQKKHKELILNLNYSEIKLNLLLAELERNLIEKDKQEQVPKYQMRKVMNLVYSLLLNARIAREFKPKKDRSLINKKLMDFKRKCRGCYNQMFRKYLNTINMIII